MNFISSYQCIWSNLIETFCFIWLMNLIFIQIMNFIFIQAMNVIDTLQESHCHLTTELMNLIFIQSLLYLGFIQWMILGSSSCSIKISSNCWIPFSFNYWIYFLSNWCFRVIQLVIFFIKKKIGFVQAMTFWDYLIDDS